MTTDGIIYYNRGQKCLTRLAVSIFSLRRSGYQGPVSLLEEDKSPRWFHEITKQHGVEHVSITGHVGNALATKARLWQFTPYTGVSLYLDSDTLVLENPKPLFDIIRPTGFGVTRFADWRSKGSRIRRRIRGFTGLIPDEELEKALAYGPAVNTGVFGFVPNHPLLPEWKELSERADKHPAVMGRTLDEIACQVLMHKHPTVVIDQQWNWSINYGLGAPKIAHFHGGKHVLERKPLCDEWKRHYWMLRSSFPQTTYNAMGECFGDRRLSHYLYTGSPRVGAPTVRRNITIVTAATPSYVPRLMENFSKWMSVANLREQKFICFLVGDPKHPAFDPIRRSSIEPVPWCPTAPGWRISLQENDIRNLVFSAFVFGVPHVITTPYWMKLDADTVPTEAGIREGMQWPEYEKATIVADPWHYTRNKPRSERSHPDGHFLNRLDRWWGGDPLFPAIPAHERHGHPRVRSFAWIERTDFTRRLAERCGGQLPIPSHDTTAWYVATRMKEPILRYKFRRWIVA